MYTIFFGIYYIKEKCVVQANLNKYANCAIIYVSEYYLYIFKILN